MTVNTPNDTTTPVIATPETLASCTYPPGATQAAKWLRRTYLPDSYAEETVPHRPESDRWPSRIISANLLFALLKPDCHYGLWLRFIAEKYPACWFGGLLVEIDEYMGQDAPCFHLFTSIETAGLIARNARGFRGAFMAYQFAEARQSAPDGAQFLVPWNLFKWGNPFCAFWPSREVYTSARAVHCFLLSGKKFEAWWPPNRNRLGLPPGPGHAGTIDGARLPLSVALGLMATELNTRGRLVRKWLIDNPRVNLNSQSSGTYERWYRFLLNIAEADMAETAARRHARRHARKHAPASQPI